MGTYSAKQKKVKVTLEGADKLIKRLKAMEEGASSVLMTGAKAGGNIALEDARNNCPTDTGALKESLKLSEVKETPVRADVKVDYDKSLKYGTFVELGTRGRPPNPFMRNAVDNNIQKIDKEITETIANMIGRKM